MRWALLILWLTFLTMYIPASESLHDNSSTVYYVIDPSNNKKLASNTVTNTFKIQTDKNTLIVSSSPIFSSLVVKQKKK